MKLPVLHDPAWDQSPPMLAVDQIDTRNGRPIASMKMPDLARPNLIADRDQHATMINTQAELEPPVFLPVDEIHHDEG